MRLDSEKWTTVSAALVWALSACSTGLPEVDPETGNAGRADAKDAGAGGAGASRDASTTRSTTAEGSGSSSQATDTTLDADASSGSADVDPIDPIKSFPETCGADSFFEPNDTPAQACRIAVEQSAKTDLVAGGDNLDQFLVHLHEGVTYTLSVNAVGCEPQLDVKGFALGSGQPVMRLSAQIFGAVAHYQLTPNLTEDVRLSFSVGSSSCAYEFIVLRSSRAGLPHDQHFEPNNSTASAASAGRAGSSNVSFPIDAVDFFRVPVRAGTKYMLMVDSTQCTPPLYVQTWLPGDTGLLEQAQQEQLGIRKSYQLAPTISGDAAVSFRVSSTACAYNFEVTP